MWQLISLFIQFFYIYNMCLSFFIPSHFIFSQLEELLKMYLSHLVPFSLAFSFSYTHTHTQSYHESLKAAL